MHVFLCHQNVYKNFNMGFISPHGLHIPIVAITKNNILLVKDIYVILVTHLQGLDFIDMVLLAWWILWFTGWSWYGTFYYNSDVYLLLHFKLCWDSIAIIHIFPVNSDFLYLQTISLKWLSCNEWFIQNRTLHECDSPQYVNIKLHRQDWCLFFRKHEVIIVTIFQISLDIGFWFNTIICGELYCKRNFSLFLLLLYIFLVVVWYPEG